jgi:hypothetical protein
MASVNIPTEKLPNVVLGRDRAFARGEAMALLAASSQPQRESLLAEVLENRNEQPRYRSVAAITLGRVFTPTAEKLLIRNLKASEPMFADVLRSLGRIGGRETLVAIDALNLPESHRAHNAAVFAAALISHRLGFPGHDLPFPEEGRLLKPATTEARLIDVGRMEGEPARAIIEALKRYPYGVEFEPGIATRFHCAGEENVVCVNREFTAAGSLARAAQRKVLLAVGALRSAETGDYSPSYLVLTSPGGTSGSVDIIITRCSGAYALAGTGRLAGDRLEFQLRSVRRPGARAISIRGVLANGIVQAAEAVSSTTRAPQKAALHAVVDRA